MKIIINVLVFAITVGILTKVSVAQVPISDDIRIRSVELERVKRQFEQELKIQNSKGKGFNFVKIKKKYPQDSVTFALNELSLRIPLNLF